MAQARRMAHPPGKAETAAAPAVKTVTGENVRRLREQLGWRQDDLAASMRRFGCVDWRRSTVAKVELGLQPPNLGELWALLCVLGVPMAELMAGDGYVRLNEVVAMRRLDLRTVATSGERPHGRFMPDAEREALQRDGAEFNAASRQAQDLWPDVAVGTVEAALAASRNDTESKTATRLGVSALAVSLIAYKLWGKSLTEKRDEALRVRSSDAPPRSLQALRGHQTRALMAEIAVEISRTDERRSKGAS